MQARAFQRRLGLADVAVVDERMHEPASTVAGERREPAEMHARGHGHFAEARQRSRLIPQHDGEVGGHRTADCVTRV